MLASVSLNSRLASARAAAVPTFVKASETLLCPAVKAIPLARKPTTGTSASPMMRVRTETEAIDWRRVWSMHAFPELSRNDQWAGAYRSRTRCGSMGRVHEMVKQVANHNLRTIRIKMNLDGAELVRRVGARGHGMTADQLALTACAAADAAEAILRAAIAAVQTRLDGAAERRSAQRALHGLAWLATYATAIRALADCAGRLQAAGDLRETDELTIAIGVEEYLAQIVGGIPMSQ